MKLVSWGCLVTNLIIMFIAGVLGPSNPQDFTVALHVDSIENDFVLLSETLTFGDIFVSLHFTLKYQGI